MTQVSVVNGFKFKDRSSFIEDHEVKEAKDLIEKELGFEPPHPCGYQMVVKLYVGLEDTVPVKNDDGSLVLGQDGKPLRILLPEAETRSEKWSSCVGLVIRQGQEVYKTGKFRRDRGFMNFSCYTEFLSCCQMLSESRFTPEEYRGNLPDILAAVQFGLRLDLSPIEALHRLHLVNGVPAFKEIPKDGDFSQNILHFLQENNIQPWCQVGDWVVIPRHEGTLINYRGVPMMFMPDDRILAVVEDPSYVTRF